MSDIIRMTQFRKVGCLDWYDGIPRGDGPYETRAVFMPDIAANRSTENGRLLRMSETLAAENKRLEAQRDQAMDWAKEQHAAADRYAAEIASLRALVAEMALKITQQKDNSNEA